MLEIDIYKVKKRMDTKMTLQQQQKKKMPQNQSHIENRKSGSLF